MNEKVMTMKRRAIEALTRMSSYLTFEKLDPNCDSSRLLRHLRLQAPFALFTAWRSHFEREENVRRSGELLLELRDSAMRAVALLAHTSVELSEDEPEFAFFAIGAASVGDTCRSLALRLGQEYEQQRVSAYFNEKLRILTVSGEEVIALASKEITPSQVKKVLGIMTGREFCSLDTGFLNADPASLASPVFHSVGLVSDVSLGTRRSTENVEISYRAFETPSKYKNSE
jgi:hypothetical protein